MANPAAFIHYPCFKDLEKSHINLVESMPHQQKFRKLRGEKKEQLVAKNSLPKENCIVKHNFACNRENSASNIASIKKKDVEVLPTLDENEEKEEKHDRKTEEIGTISEPQTTFEKFRAEADPTTKTSRKFSNHSLVAPEAFDKPSIPPIHAKCEIEQQIPNKKMEILEETPNNERNTSSLNESLDESTSISGINLSQKEPENWRFTTCDQNKATLMPNTSEFQELNSNESLHVLGGTSRSTSEHEPKTPTGGFRKFKKFLGFVWALSFAGLVICMAVNIIAGKTKPTQAMAFKPTVREICLLIARNVRRLIVSPIYRTNPNVI